MMGDECAVEISAEEPDVLSHRAANLWIDFAIATRNAWQLHRAAHDVKSAYELAMERLEKSAPSVALNDAQKAEIAEIDSTYRARIAEKELFLKDQIRQARTTGAADEAESLEKQLAIEVRRLHSDCEEKKEKLRRSFTS